MREKIFVLLSRAVDAAGGLLLLKLISTYVPKAEVGEYLLMASLLAIMTALSTSALDVGIMRHVDGYRQDGSLPARYSAILSVYLGSGLFLLGASTVLVGAGGAGVFQWAPVLSLWFACDATRSFVLNTASSLRARARVLLVGVVEQSMRLGVLLSLSRQTAMQAEDVVQVLSLASFSSACVCILAQRDLLSRFQWPSAVSTLAESIRFVWPMMVWGGFSWLQNMSSRWVLDYFSTPVDVAEFGVFVMMANFPIAALQGVVSTYLLPILYERENIVRGSSRPLIRKAALTLAMACASLVGVLFLFHHDLVALIASKDYGGRSYVVPWLMLSIACSAVGSVFALSVYVEKRLHLLVAANIIPGVAVVALGVLLIKTGGLQGAAVAFCVGHLLAGVLFFWAHRKSYRHDGHAL